MTIFLLIAGIISLVVSFFCFKHRSYLKDSIFAVKSTSTSTIAELQKLQTDIARELEHSGSFREIVELKGVIRSNNPLTSDLSKRLCVYYQSIVKEKYEKTEYTTDSEGNRQRNTSQGTKVINNNQTQINFRLEDETGTIVINPKDAEMEAIQVVNRFEPVNSGKSSFSIAGLNISLSGSFSNDYRTLGYNYEEYVLPIDIPIYVLGELSDADNQLIVRKPFDPKKHFIISHKSEEELIRDHESNLKTTTFFAIFCLVGGIILLVASVF